MSFTLGAMPALATQRALPKVRTATMHRLEVPASGVGTTFTARGTMAKPFVGAVTRVTQAGLAPKAARSYPALPPPSSRPKAGTEQAASAVSGGAYFSLSPTRLLDTRTNGGTLGPNSSLNLTVTGGSVPSDAIAAALNVTVTGTTADSYLSVYPTGGSQPLVSNLNWAAGETVPNLVIVPIGTGGQVTFYNHTGQANVIADLEGYFAPESSGSTSGSYVPLTPARITDTRSGSGYPNAGAPLSAGGSLNVQVMGAGGVPSSGVTAVLMNVTVTDTTAASYLTAYPSGASLPTASNLNWTAGETVANRVVVPVGSNGGVTLYNHTGTVDVIVDVNGYFTNGTTAPAAASLYMPITPVRVLDTRQTGGALGAGSTLNQQMAGADGIPSGAAAVVSNVTAVDTTETSYFTVYPTGGSRPTASDVNWSAGQIVPNLTVATLSAGGSVSVYNHAGSAAVLIDAFGYFLPESSAGALTITTTSLPGGTVGTAYTQALAASGGTPPYSWTISSGALPSGLTLSSGGVISGTPTSAGTASFGVTVTDASGPTPETASAHLSIQVAAAEETLAYDNWSGYAVQGSQTAALAATSVTGTFTVPDLTYAASCSDVMSVWNGIDGSSNEYLIQAGVELTTVIPYGAGAGSCTPGEFYITPWWEVITPTNLAPETYIETWDNGSQAVVSPGDQVTVTINQVSLGAWDIILTDDTTGGTFDYAQYYGSDVSYAGPGASAEWIVEDSDQPSNPNCTWPGNGLYLCPMPAYSPPVSFTGTGFNYTGAYGETDRIYMVDQSGNIVSQPSSLATNGDFTVSYVGSGTNAPNGAVTVGTLGSMVPTIPRVSTSTLSPPPYTAP
ncbi:MAG: putative Ig domain-containing protein [Candidatus Dormibacteraeota bacterium]|nr:putative Ig domain-containing protein [Candidatus Dormibacteraeota bacterium]